MKTKSVQKNIPDEWLSQTLGDFLEKMEGGGTPSKDNDSFWLGTIPWASVKDVVTHNPYDTQDHISKEGLNNSSSRIVTKGTLIVPTRMALGHAVVFCVDVAINQDLKALYPKKELDNKYLYYWFQSKKTFIAKLGAGSTVSGIQQSELKSLKFLLPPLPEQNRIVSVLETWDRGVERLGRVIEIKKRIKKGLMQKLLTGAVRLLGFTEAWETVKLGDVCLLNPKSGNLPSTFVYIDLESVEKGRLLKENKISLEGAPSRAQRVLKIDDVIFQMVRPYQGNNLFFQKMGNYVASTGYAQLRAKGSPWYLYYLLHTDNFVNQVLDRCTGTNYPAINSSDLSEIEIKIPIDKKEQTAIADILTTADTEITALEKKLALLKDQKKYLLNNLITGTIRTLATIK